MKFLNRFAGRCAALFLSAVMAASNISYAAEDDERTLPSGVTFGGLTKRMDILMQNSSPYSNEKMPATAAIVFSGDETVYEKYFGMVNIGVSEAADENTVFEWGSISKTMIWVSVMQLWEQGRLDLDKDIREYLPEDFFSHLRYDDPITMTELMNHQGGWGETTYSIFVKDEKDIGTLEEALRANEPVQSFRPGEVTSYSNWGAALAGYIVERVSGMDYAEYLHKNILDPLGLEHTAVAADHRDNLWVRQQREKLRTYSAGFLMTGYYDSGDRLYYIPLYPSGSVTGTAGDLAKYAQAFVDDSHPLFSNAETQEKLFAGSAFYGESDVPYCSCGFWREDYAVPVYSHDGSTVSGCSNMLFDLKSKTGLVMLTTLTDYNAVWAQLPKYVFGEPSLDSYMTGNEKPVETESYYLPSRSFNSGLLKFVRCLDAAPGKKLGNITDRGDGLCFMNGSAVLLGRSSYSDGKEGFMLGAQEYISEKMYVPQLVLLAGLFISAVFAAFILLAKRKLRKSGKLTVRKSEAVLSAAQAAKVVSVLALIAAVANIISPSGLSGTEGAVIGTVQLICLILCAAAAVVGIIRLIGRKSSGYGRIYSACSAAGNILSAAAVVFFEMYRFWGC